MALKFTVGKNVYYLYGHGSNSGRGFYYFKKQKLPGPNALDEIPEGYKIAQMKNGVPYLKWVGK